MTYNVRMAVKAQEDYCDRTGAPNFAGDGVCWRCGMNVYTPQKFHDGLRGISVEEAGQRLVTGCPHCHASFVE